MQPVSSVTVKRKSPSVEQGERSNEGDATPSQVESSILYQTEEEEDPWECSSSSSKKETSKSKSFTTRQWLLLIFFAIINFLCAITISLQAPFYPQEAEKKGATATEYGFVFGIFEFIVFAVSPIYGKYIHKLGPKRVFSTSLIIASSAIICFGLMDKIDDRTTFIALSLVCRTVEALGSAGFFLATFTIIAIEFPNSIATTFASLETFFGLGFIVGPTIGGILFGYGGFPFPFFTVGGCVLLLGIASIPIFPQVDKATDKQDHGGILQIFKIPSIALTSIGVTVTSLSVGFVSATLEPHIRRFGLTPLQTGLVFIVNGGIYAITTPIFGYICDNIKRPILISILGNFLIFFSFLWIGPSDIIPLDTTLWLTIVGLVFNGLGFAASNVAGFIVAFQDSLKNGLPDNTSTYGLASGLWQTMISFGAFAGPVLSGVLYDHFGFRTSSWLCLVLSGLIGTCTLIYACSFSSNPDKPSSESQPLLLPPSLLGEKGTEDEKPKKSSYGSTKDDTV